MIKKIIKLGVFAAAISMFSCAATTPIADMAGQPESAGLVVVDAMISVSDVSQVKTNAFSSEAYLVRVGGPSEALKGKKSSGLLLFSNLAPGRYRLSKVKSVMMSEGEIYNKSYPIPNIRKEMTFDVRAGSVLYVGKLIIKDFTQTRRGNISYDFDHEPAYEVAAWQELIKSYKGSPWSLLIEERLKKLKRGLT